MGSGMGLRIEIKHTNALAAFGEGCGKVHRGRCLANATLLVDDRDPSHGSSSCDIHQF